MGFSYDVYKRIKQNRLILANPQGNDIGVLSGVKEFKFKEYANSIDDLSFKIYEYEDGIRNEHYDLLEDMRLIKAQDYAVFQIKEVNDVHGDDIPVGYKEVSCKSLENELIGKYIDSLDGVYGLYDNSNQDYSILHIVAKYCTWEIGSVSPTLLSKYRTISIDSEKIYNFLTSTVSDSFNCIFQFDTWNKVINVITLEEFGTLTDIVLSNKNVLKQYTKKSDLDKIVTKMRVRGGTDTSGQVFDIRAINPDGSSEISNVNYYKTTEWMSQSLIDSLNDYQIAYDTYSTQSTSAVSLLKQYQAELDTLSNQLAEIKSQISAQEVVKGASVKLHYGRPPVSGESDYTNYQTAISQITLLNAQQLNKEIEIANKNTQIMGVQDTLINIGNSLDKSNYFTEAKLKELDSFLTMGDEYSDETFAATDEMTEEEIIQMKLELKANAEAELAKVCRPSYVVETSLSNLWTIQDDKDSKVSYELWKNQIKVGNLITLKLRPDYIIQVRVMSIEYDFDDIENVNIVFSDKNRLDDYLSQLGEVLAQSQSTSKSFSVNYYGMLKASQNVSSFSEFSKSVLNASLNQMKSDEKGEITFDEFGIHAKQVLSDGSIGSHQMWLNPWRMLFSDNNFQSANTAFGLLSLPDGTQRMGINTDVIIGNLVMTSALTISNENNTITLNKDGANFVNCDITINRGTNILTLNATDGIKLTKNGVKQFGIDANGDAIFSGLITGGSLNINNNCTIDSSGYLSATGATFTGGSFTLVNGANNITLNALSGITSNTPSGKINIDGAYIMGWNSSNENTLSIDYGGNISCSAVLATFMSINNNSVLHVGNLVSQCQSNGLVVPNASNASTAQSSWYLNNVITANYSAMYPMEDATISCGRSGGKWSAVYAGSGTIITSDRNKKNSIQDLDDRYLNFANKINPQIFKYNEGTSDRYHVGFIAQSIEEAMTDCNLSDKDFAGLVKSPKYLKKMIDDKGNELDEFDTSSEIVGYDYSLRYDEFIPLLYAKINKLESEISNLKNMITL